MKKNMFALKLSLSACLCLISSAGAQTVLVEAESFANPSGWVVDQQFMDQVGSPFLMAHGLGVPCEDATKEVVFPETGVWRVWVRTRNWVYKKQRVVDAEDNISLFLSTHAFRVEMNGNKISAVVAKDIRTSEELRFSARFFADCTGDATIGYLAGADYRMGRECRADTGESLAPEKADTMTMGATVMWRSRLSAGPTSFPECPWAIRFNERNARRTTKAEWSWETGMNLNQITDFEQIRDHGLRAAFGNWDFVKNKSRDREAFAERGLEWVAYISGNRESRRLLGDVILKEQDILGRREFPDASVTCTWSIDLHYPDPKNTEDFPGAEFLSIAVHKRYKPGYPIPYRCFYSRNIENLFMAGRDISVTHVALGTVRVMRTTGMMGEVVGMAASICKDWNSTPRGVYQDHLDKLKTLMRKGIGPRPLRHLHLHLRPSRPHGLIRRERTLLAPRG